jgi:flagellar biosynthetic protein FlhB
MAEELGERTEQPTGRRLGEARSKGQIAKSQDLSSAVDLTGAVVLIALCGSAGLAAMSAMLRRVLEDQTPGESLSIDSVQPLALWAASQAARVAGPALLAMFAIAVLAQVVQVGWVYTTHPIQPNFTRLNPVAGIRRLLNLKSLVKTIVNVIKLGMVVLIAYLVIGKHMGAIAALPSLGLAPGLYKMSLLAAELTAWLLAIFLSIGVIDYLYQRWQHTHDLRMTRQEVKDERRSVDGDPEVKGRRLRMAREIAMQRIQHAVPKADVIVTNPTHFSVALRYDPTTMHAPRVIAKGADLLAFKIRNVAIGSRIPIVERPPLARGLYWGVEIGQEIKPEFYEAVAEVLAYVYRLKDRAA